MVAPRVTATPRSQEGDYLYLTGVDERPSVASVSVSDERMSVGERMSVASMRDECRMVCCFLG